MTVCQKTHKCEDCGKYAESDTGWPCLASHCPHHPSVKCEFTEKVKND